MTDGRRGFLMGLGAYGLWGLFPLYWPLLEPAGALEILAHRVAWSAVVMVVLVVAVRRTAELRRHLRSPRTVLLMAAASAVIGANWGLFIWGVNNDHVIETSLGYFINPLVTVLLGVFVLGERLRAGQWASLGLAAVAVAALTIDYGRPPWLALSLACSFAAYGLIKKTAGVGAVEGLTVETLLLAPVALGFLVLLGAHGGQHFTGCSPPPGS
jgi:chloramphenicol-sensitive protein RarD